jgi:uncharacterized protein (DUF1778 family)
MWGKIIPYEGGNVASALPAPNLDRRWTMAATALGERPANRDVTLNIRAKRSVVDLIDHAADALGKNRSGFMLEAATRAAEDVLLDRTLFILDDERYERFVAALDAPPTPNPRLMRLLGTRAPWER